MPLKTKRRNATFHAPYERPMGRNAEGRHSASREHGGYGVLYEGYINGPFFFFETAQATAARIHGRTVRWIDFAKESSRDESFRNRLATLDAPLTFPVYGPGQLAPIVWPVK